MKRTRRRRLLVFLLAVIVFLQIRQFWTVTKVLRDNSHQDEDRALPQQQQLTGYDDIVPPPPLVSSPYNGTTSFAACLLVSDDNHWLIEWLAYHHLKLPLRYLVVSNDPRARTLPDGVLERWKQLMTIVEWTDENFLPKHWRNRNISDTNAKGLLMKHRERQRHFYPACFDYLQKVGRTWVAVVDVDEFVAINPYYVNADEEFQQTQDNSNNQTVLQMIKQSSVHRNASCITIPRLRFGTYMDENSTTQQHCWIPREMQAIFQDADFLTLQWKWRGPLNSRKVNKLPKSILDVSAIASFDRQDTDAHRPSRSSCPRRNLYTPVHESPWVIHHYVGSREQFLFRKDARQQMDTRSEAKLEEYGRIRGGKEDYSGAWLPDFVQSHGVVKAQALLEGVGNVSFTPQSIANE